MSEENGQIILDEMKKAHKDLKQYVDDKVSVRSTDPLIVEPIQKINTRMDELQKNYDKVITKMNRPAAKEGDLSEDELNTRNAFTKFIRQGNKAEYTDLEKRALSGLSDGNGEFLAPIDFSNQVLMNAYNEGTLRSVASVNSTGRSTVFLPSLSKPSAGWGTRGLQISEDTLSAGGHTIEIHDIVALSLFHNNELEDAQANIWSKAAQGYANAFEEVEDLAFATGSNPNEPQGILSNTDVQANFTVSGVSGALTDSTHNGFDVIGAALANLKTVYRRKAVIGLNSTTEWILRQVKDGDGRYLWQPPLQVGDPSTIFGKRIIVSEGMPDADTNGKFPIFVGDIKQAYQIYDRKGMTVQRLSEKYAEYQQTGFILTRRVGAQVVLPEAVQLIKIGT